CGIEFGGWTDFATRHHALEYIVFPFMIWAAVRFGPRGATAAIALVVGSAIWGTIHLQGPFARASVSEGLFLMWLFIGVVAIPTLLLAAAMAERKHAELAMR